jgi:uncharacterized LabA/DUF88 family protein
MMKCDPHTLHVDSHYFASYISSPLGIPEQVFRDERWCALDSGIQVQWFRRGTSENCKEKGVDTALTATAVERSIRQGYDILFLLAGDGDFVPTVSVLRKYTKIVLLAWNIDWTDWMGTIRPTRVANKLVDTADRTLWMRESIDKGLRSNDVVVDRLFSCRSLRRSA